MPSQAQLDANASNAQHSTGPRTPEGKAASSRNNLRHGFRSQSVLLPGDDPAEYDALLAELTAHYAPGELTEQRFIREMADAEWRLRHVRQHMESAITRRITALSADHPDSDPMDHQSVAIESMEVDGPSYATWLRYETKFERQYDRALKDWTRYQEAGRRAHDKDADIMMKEALFSPLPDAPLAASLGSNVQNPAAPPAVPRSALCPCGSGGKYKRCCGRNAPPVLNTPFPEAA